MESPWMKKLRVVYYRYWTTYLKMKKGYFTFRQHRRSFYTFGIVLALVTLLLFHLTGPVVVVEKAILRGKTLHSALHVMKNFHFSGKAPLLVLFTSFQQQPTKDHIYRNTLRNWGQLRPMVQPVLYNDNLNAYYVELAKAWGWTVLPVPKRHRDTIPILRHMFLNATGTFQSTFYGYANGDILFDESLIFTLWSVYKNDTIKKPFLIGRRANFDVKRDDKLYETSYVRLVADRSEAKLFVSDAQDYFITTRNGFPWFAIPDFVIGRIGYDNWLVIAALKRKDGIVIDATNTILCLHQSGDDGNFAGFGAQKYVNHNLDLAGSDFQYYLGKTDCATWETNFNHTTGTVVVQHRVQNVCGNNI